MLLLLEKLAAHHFLTKAQAFFLIQGFSRHSIIFMDIGLQNRLLALNTIQIHGQNFCIEAKITIFKRVFSESIINEEGFLKPF